MRIVYSAGTPREIGQQTGEQLREDIREHIDQFPPTDNSAWEKRGRIFLRTLRDHLPRVLEEMKGTAEGAGVTNDDIYRLNLPLYPDTLTALDNQIPDKDGCTNIVFGTGPDGPLWGKNNDGGAPGNQRPVCVRVVRPATGIPMILVHFAGYVAVGDGVNEEGVAIGHSSVGSIYQQSDHHVPVRLLAYHALHYGRNVSEFVQGLSSLPTRGKGYSFVCVDRDGAMCAPEVPCPLIQIRQAESANAMYCVNCYQLPHLRDADQRSPDGKANAIRRAERLEREIWRDIPLNLSRMRGLLKSHESSAPICRHDDNDSHTEYSMIAIPRQGKLLVADGYPCETEYHEVRF
jgi:acyl-CoA:6-aminopenicillanic acid acyl transferase